MGCQGSKPVENAVQPVGQRPTKPVVKRGKNIVSPQEVAAVPEEPKSTYAIYQSSHSGKLVVEKECALRGIAAIQSGEVVAADYKNNVIKLFGTKYNFLHSLEFSSAPWDVCQAFDDPISVFTTVPYMKEVHRVLVDKSGAKPQLVELKSFRANGFCWGITCFDGGIAVSIKVNPSKQTWPTPPVFQIDLHEYDGILRRSIIYDINGSPYFLEPKYLNVTVDNLFLLVSDYKQNTVYCINNEDELIYAYKGLKSPNGLAMDEKKNVHVTSFFGTHRVHKIGANGKYLDGLAHDEERPLFPHSICYKQKDKTIVLTVENSLEVYKLI